MSDVVGVLRAAGCVFAEDEARLLQEAAPTPEALAALVDRRVSGVPLEHVLGWAEFCGLRIAVADGVFVPRRRTELLAGEAVARARPGQVIVELCCGAAAITTVLLDRVDAVDVYAADVDPAAVACARRNVGERVFDGDLYAALPPALRGRVDMLIANAPYVPTDALATMPAEARLYEPRVALDGGPDGLDVLRRVIEQAPSWLVPGGQLLVEASADQAPVVVAAMANADVVAEVVTDEDATAVVGVWRGGGAAQPA